jgi:N-acyl-D-amino-acid deacylase
LTFDVVIKNGRVIDGAGNTWFKADLGIKNERIERISYKELENGHQVIDATGLVVCPGFINPHSHSDGSILYHNKAENCLSMGVTTELTGQCGNSVAPMKEGYKKQVSATIKRRICPLDEPVNWLTLNEWLEEINRRGTGINIAPLVGHGTLRGSVMGVEGEGGERISPTRDELDEMKAMLRQAMTEGGFGLSTGLNYAPGRNALTDEVIELATVASEYAGVYASHMRCEGNLLIEATKEFIEICETAGVRGIISHHKASGSGNYGKASETIRMVDRARAKGVNVIIDQYPWRFGGTIKSLGTRFLPTDPTIQASSQREVLIKQLKDDKHWAKLKASAIEQRDKEIESYQKRHQGMLELEGWATEPYAMDTSGTILYSPSHPELESKTLDDVAQFYGVDDIWEGIRRILIDDDGKTIAGAEPYSEDDIKTILKYPWTTVSTDQYAFDTSKITQQLAFDALGAQHPRGWGTYPKILGKYVREEKVLSIEEAVRKMTSLPATFLGLWNRGLVREEFFADLVVFDPKKIANRATYSNPQVPPEGIKFVFVNGELAVSYGKLTGSLTGKTLRCWKNE